MGIRGVVGRVLGMKDSLRHGHTDDQITKNMYLHVTQEMKKKPRISSLNS